MMIDKHAKRLKQIKYKLPMILPLRCDCCRNDFIRESMYAVSVINYFDKRSKKYYCTHCMKSREDIANHISTKSSYLIPLSRLHEMKR